MAAKAIKSLMHEQMAKQMPKKLKRELRVKLLFEIIATRVRAIHKKRDTDHVRL